MKKKKMTKKAQRQTSKHLFIFIFYLLFPFLNSDLINIEEMKINQIQ